MITASFITFCDVTIEQDFHFARLVSTQNLSLFFFCFVFFKSFQFTEIDFTNSNEKKKILRNIDFEIK